MSLKAALFEFLNKTDPKDLSRTLDLFAAWETAEFIIEHMSDVQSVPNRREVHSIALELATVRGPILEFGVSSGDSLRMLAGMTNQVVHGFDSFQGLPEVWRDGFPEGAFKQNPSRTTDFSGEIEIHQGLFEDSIPAWLHKNSSTEMRVRYIHIDCDLYSSTKTVLHMLTPHLVPGTVIVFDEYFNYPGWQRGEFRAFAEWVEETGSNFRYLTYNREHEQVAVILSA
jgi:hypothetical protein